MGIGKPPLGWEVADYVLARFSQEEERELKERLLPHAKEAIESFLEGKMEWDRLVCHYSLKPSTPKEKA